jgi:spore germination cell wall hydrolase CwlJ-like protein
MSRIATGNKAAFVRAASLIGGAAFIALLGASFAEGHANTPSQFSPALSLRVEATPHSAVELAAVKQASEQRCLAEALYYEARGEGEEGQKAIAEVILARVESKLYPKTICDVVYQGASRKTGCQFSFACDGSLLKKKHHAAWEQAELLAAKIVNGSLRLAGRTSKAVSFHTVGVTPVWSRTMMRVTQIGNHIFYRHMPKSMRPSQFATVEPVKVLFEQAGTILPEITVVEDAIEQTIPEVQVAAQPNSGA